MTLDRRYGRGGMLDFLAGLPALMVFNDEAHHIHELKREGETTEVEWQKSLTRIADGKKDRRFVQVDFSATPYNDVGSGKNKHKAYFPHIVVDFDLKDGHARGAGEVAGAGQAQGNRRIAAGVQGRARRGWQPGTLRRTARDAARRAAQAAQAGRRFRRAGSARHPKMLVVCEDTSVSPLVARFPARRGLSRRRSDGIDSGRKAELGEKEWAPVRERLFDVDRHAAPRVIVSVLMLREGFDVNNICVIVPLRSAQAQILLEQTIGRGLRLMWREPDYADIKRENRERINNGHEPASLIDILSIVEHPAFQSFYDELMPQAWPAAAARTAINTSSTGDMIVSVGLRDGYEAFDFAIPFICARRKRNSSIARAGSLDLPPFHRDESKRPGRHCWARATPSCRRICRARRCSATIASKAR
jgi:type III restriction enzyme